MALITYLALITHIYICLSLPHFSPEEAITSVVVLATSEGFSNGGYLKERGVGREINTCMFVMLEDT